MTRDELCVALRSNWYLTPPEIDAILAEREFFQPHLKNALAHRASIASVSESPIDPTDSHAIFLLTEIGDTSIIPDLLKCLRMNEDDLHALYGDVLTEHMWLPFARLGFNSLDDLWQFATDTSVYDFARHAAIRGIIAMHHFHPGRRPDTVAFIERLLGRTDCFPIDHMAGILCDCADSGLMELTDRAKEFAGKMIDDGEEPYPMATADDVLRAFEKGPRRSYITERLHSVFDVNKVWQHWAEAREDKEEDDDEFGSLEDEDGIGEFPFQPEKSSGTRIGRNDPCPCESGKKYKKCHGA